MQKNLRMSKKSSTFAPAFETKPHFLYRSYVRELTKIGDYFRK